MLLGYCTQDAASNPWAVGLLPVLVSQSQVKSFWPQNLTYLTAFIGGESWSFFSPLILTLDFRVNKFDCSRRQVVDLARADKHVLYRIIERYLHRLQIPPLTTVSVYHPVWGICWECPRHKCQISFLSQLSLALVPPSAYVCGVTICRISVTDPRKELTQWLMSSLPNVW